jgi:hypothetical protein
MNKIRPKYIYIILCIFGTVLPYSQLIPLILQGDMSISMMNDLFANRVSTLFALDLFVTATTFLFFAIYEGIKHHIKYLWAPIIATFLVGASLGFPLFLYLREINQETR